MMFVWKTRYSLADLGLVRNVPPTRCILVKIERVILSEENGAFPPLPRVVLFIYF